MIATTTPRIYVASLSDYNAGRLHGAWIDLDGDPDTLRESIAAMLATSPEPIAEEWAVHDYDNFPNMGEWPDLDQLSAVAAAMIEVQENGINPDAFTAWLENDSTNLKHPEQFLDAFVGEYDSEEHYAQDYAESCGVFDALPEHLRGYIDWESYARDLFMDMWTAPTGWGTVFVFQDC